MRVIWMVVLLMGLASWAGAGSPDVRTLPDIDTSVFTCAPNPAHRFIASQADLETVLSSLAPHCEATEFEARKSAFLRDLARARMDWSDEVLVIAMDWYGTGMAKPSLAFSGPSDGLLTANIQWRVPPPPLTPDTASCRLAFAVRRSAATRIEVVGGNSGTATFAVSR